MAGETTITVIGNLTADPDMRYTQSGLAVANFSIASTPRTFDRQANEFKDGETLYLRCSAWRELGEHVAASLTKGTRVVASGRLEPNSYEKDGQKITTIQLTVDEIGPSLRYATAQVTKQQQNQNQGQRQQQYAQQQNGGQQPPQQGYSAPQQQGYGAPQQGGYAPPQQQGYGAPQGGYQGPPQGQAPQGPPQGAPQPQAGAQQQPAQQQGAPQGQWDPNAQHAPAGGDPWAQQGATYNDETPF